MKTTPRRRAKAQVASRASRRTVSETVSGDRRAAMVMEFMEDSGTQDAGIGGAQ